MENKITLRQWQSNFNSKLYASKDVNVQCDAGWYDWFCTDASLSARLNKMGSIIKKIKDGGKVNLDNTTVWFKNNCPINGPLYDDFRISDIVSGINLFVVNIDCHWYKQKYNVFQPTNSYKEPTFSADTVDELIEWFNMAVAGPKPYKIIADYESHDGSITCGVTVGEYATHTEASKELADLRKNYSEHGYFHMEIVGEEC